MSSARNLGVQTAKGEYITFVDADDTIVENVYPMILEFITKNELDGYYFGVSRGKAETGELNLSVIEQKTTICSPNHIAGIHGAIYKKSILTDNKIVFNTSMPYQEDLLFNFQYIQSVQKIGVTKLSLYIYRKNDESVTANFYQRKTNYGDTSTKEYRCYASRILFLKEIKKYSEEKPENFLCKKLLSLMTAELLWFAVRCSYPAKKVFNDIRENGLSVKDIKSAHIVGSGAKKLIKYSLRLPLAYKVACKVFKPGK